ncbi:MIP/aquaporin family protein [Alkalihalobacterium alkalinitrilicum]|uniref:MIP/aquaporin family protein n=1 Tax=Alkalihalobacterium alkalinitrilicum TaxID=427920 RepID=UPI000994D2E0|nr:MIP family channel protein [Alkalihalobacterium alkalinitrilicum]
MKVTKGEVIAEFIGCFILIFIGAGCVASLVLNGSEFGMWEISIIWGMGISLALYMTATISGAHINPAVTLSLALYRGFPWKKVIPYVIAQVVGAFTGAATVYFLYYQAFQAYQETTGILIGSVESQGMASIFSTFPAPYLSWFSAGIIELVITAVLIAGIFAFIDERNAFAPPKYLFPLAVGILVAILGGAFGSLTGFAMNPARDFGPKLFTSLVGWGEVALPAANWYFLVPIIFPLLGAVVGGAIYDRLIRKHLPSEHQEVVEDIELNEQKRQSV